MYENIPNSYLHVSPELRAIALRTTEVQYTYCMHKKIGNENTSTIKYTRYRRKKYSAHSDSYIFIITKFYNNQLNTS